MTRNGLSCLSVETRHHCQLRVPIHSCITAVNIIQKNAAHLIFNAAPSSTIQGYWNLNSDNCLATFAEDAAQRLSTMSHLPPELPSPCQQKSIKTPVIEVIDIGEIVQRSLPSEYSLNGQTVSIGQARKRALAVLIVLTNLVPVCQPTVLFRTC